MPSGLGCTDDAERCGGSLINFQTVRDASGRDQQVRGQPLVHQGCFGCRLCLTIRSLRMCEGDEVATGRV